ncbi:MAG: glycosyltransferase [Candidatus Bathyarchaeota archaeon]|nr:glycosyltransferase [Candidatus Bathyarchaeota archaeon]
MLIIIRNEEKLSLKTNFVTQLFRLISNNKVIYVFRKDSEKFGEKWLHDQVKLASSVRGVFLSFLLMMLKSPKDFRNGLMVRLSLLKRKHTLIEKGFFSILSNTLYLFFGSSVRANRLIRVLNQLCSPKIFLIDEFLSLNCFDLKKLKLLGPIIYVSQDLAYKRFGFGDNFITRKLMFKLEQDAVVHFDLVVACSEMEKLKYLEMGARHVIFYPNIYPTREFEPCDKAEIPRICIVLREHWGSRGEQSLEIIFNALACLDRQISVCLLGIKPSKVPKNIVLEHYEFLQSKLDYLEVLSKSWIGINVGIHMAGTNERKYDYAEAGTVVLSDILGARGDLLPYEYTYVDSHDLAAKIGQLLEFSRTSLIEMGEKNRKHVLSMAEKERLKLLDNIGEILKRSNLVLDSKHVLEDSMLDKVSKTK